MANNTNRYDNPLCKRYAGRQMQALFSDDNKFQTWRMLWVALAESQKELGLDITDGQIDEMKARVQDIDYKLAEKFERETRHDVMAHIKAFGEQCPKAKPIIHLGATSCYVGDNTDIIIQRSALLHVKAKLVNAINELYKLAHKYKDLPCLAYTHFQAAQPTTVGKRVCLWIQDLMFDLERLEYTIASLKLLGCKGTTGTAASFLALFDGDMDKVRQLEAKIARKMGFDDSIEVIHGYIAEAEMGFTATTDAVYPVSGQTYSRKVDYYSLSVLSGIAQSACKFSNDIRLLSHLKEVDEPFETGQVGSSAMAYKRNPMRSERIASLARYVMVDALNPALTASSQWLERTLDDSANRRIAIPEAFLATDGILSLMINIAGGLTVYPKMIEKHLGEELPFMATENILMHCVKKGGDRQELHEKIRVHCVETAKAIKRGGDNNLVERILGDPAFGLTKEELNEILRVEDFIGMAAEQTEEYLEQVATVLDGNRDLLGIEIEIKN